MMFRLPLLATAIVIATVVAAQAAPDPVLDADPFTMEALLQKPQTEPGLRDYLEGAVTAARLDDQSAAPLLRAAWSNPKTRPAIARRAMADAGNIALRDGHYADAATFYDRAISEYADTLDADTRAGLDQARGVAMALRDQPPQSAEKHTAGRVPLGVSPLGLTTAPVLIDGKAQQAVVDTGANISTLSETAAKALGVKRLTRKTSVSSSTTDAVDSTLAIAHTLKLGSMTFHNVAFLVVSDAALSPLGPQSRIDVIIGYPVLAALGRITFRDVKTGKPGTARELAFAPSPLSATPGNLRFDGFSAYAQVKANGQTLPFLLDSGANKTVFEARYGREHPEALKGLERKAAMVGGAGKVVTQTAAILPSLNLTIGNATVTLKEVRIELDGDLSDTRLGTIGSDVLWAKGGYTLDFGKRELTLGQ
ncbi:MAG TPA: aspartyl protease family protein [Rhizomicrobium sp.]|jgi:predicted aspartyl protease|nr:aspartyl protease family protein [Rhizomicrobium sp.]